MNASWTCIDRLINLLFHYYHHYFFFLLIFAISKSDEWKVCGRFEIGSVITPLIV